MQAKTIPVEPLESKHFAPFGDVIEAKGNPHNINQGRCLKFSELSRLETDVDGHVNIHIYHTNSIEKPFTLQLLERHPLGSQCFIPLQKQRFLVVVAEDSCDRPNLTTLRCFLSNGEQGVTYKPGTWHHPLLSIDAGAAYLVVDRGGPGKNCDEVLLPTDFTVEAPK